MYLGPSWEYGSRSTKLLNTEDPDPQHWRKLLIILILLILKFKITLQLDPDPQKWLQIDIPVKQSGFVNSWVFKRLNFIFLNVLLGFFDISNSVWRISCSFGGLAIFYLLFSSLPPPPLRKWNCHWSLVEKRIVLQILFVVFFSPQNPFNISFHFELRRDLKTSVAEPEPPGAATFRTEPEPIFFWVGAGSRSRMCSPFFWLREL